MRAILRLLLLPLRAPMLLLLTLVCIYMGSHWNALLEPPPQTAPAGVYLAYQLFWPVQCLQAVLVVMVCTLPDLMLRQLSLLMSSSKAITLVLTLLLVITGGLYLLHLNVLADVLILGSAVLLARLDLTRIRFVPPPIPGAICLALLVLAGIWVGARLPPALLLQPS